MANTLYLHLEGPLQSWGERGRWSIRDTAPEPTKSGVIGLLGCAMGIGDDAALRQLSEAFHMGVRVDRPGTRLVDYHTIGGGYEEPMLLTAEGKPKKSSGSPHTEISERAYLCDASFVVALIGPEALVARAAAALQDPVWPYFLGRKSCPPTRPVFTRVGDTPSSGRGIHHDLVEALKEVQWESQIDGDKRAVPPARLRVVVECDATVDGAVRRRDELVARSYRLFGPRYTRTDTIETPIQEVQP